MAQVFSMEEHHCTRAFAQAVHELRRQKHWTIPKLVQESGVGYNTLLRLEKGRRCNITLAKAFSLATALRGENASAVTFGQLMARAAVIASHDEFAEAARA